MSGGTKQIDMKKVTIYYDYIINCSAEIEVDDDFDVDDEDQYDEVEGDLPDDKIDITINGIKYDCDYVGISSITEQ
jgi:hypothetical protein